MTRAVDHSPAGEASEGGRRRRDRHRRGDRSERADRAAQPEIEPATEAAGALITSAVPAADIATPREQTASMGDAPPVVTPTLATEPLPAMKRPEYVPEPVRAAEPVSTVEPTRAEQPLPVESRVASTPAQPPAPAAHPIAAIPPISMTLPLESGLEIVETRFKPAPEPEVEAAPVGRRRVRPPRVETVEEPLQIVETRKGEQPPVG
jgi:hypothetical protein